MVASGLAAFVGVGVGVVVVCGGGGAVVATVLVRYWCRPICSVLLI